MIIVNHGSVAKMIVLGLSMNWKFPMSHVICWSSTINCEGSTQLQAKIGNITPSRRSSVVNSLVNLSAFWESISSKEAFDSVVFLLYFWVWLSHLNKWKIAQHARSQNYRLQFYQFQRIVAIVIALSLLAKHGICQDFEKERKFFRYFQKSGKLMNY